MVKIWGLDIEKKYKFGKRGMEIEMLGWWVIALIVLAVVLGGYLILKGKASAAIEFFKHLLRFGR